MFYIQFCLSNGNQEDIEIYYDEYPNNTDNAIIKKIFRALLEDYADRYSSKMDTDDKKTEMWWKCKDNSYWCDVTKEEYDEAEEIE